MQTLLNVFTNMEWIEALPCQEQEHFKYKKKCCKQMCLWAKIIV